MNPFLEQEAVWHSFQRQFAAFCAEIITAQVRPNYIVTLDATPYLHELPASLRLRGTRPVDHVEDVFIAVRRRDSQKVTTAIELLSFTNKRPGSDREKYIAKRTQYIESETNLVEIDLLRGFQRMTLQRGPDCQYCVQVVRCGQHDLVEVYPFMLRDSLPMIPIPLLAPDRDVRLNLQTLLHRLYDAGGYEDYIYSGEPRPPLSPADQTWAREVLDTAGIRR
jgi:hypothetical protein